MRAKVSDLRGAALDWAVAKGAGRGPQNGHGWSPSTDWAQGGPLIESVGISVNGAFIGHWEASLFWSVKAPGDKHKSHHTHRGPSPLVAAMRCFVASKLGDEIEIPEALTVNR